MDSRVAAGGEEARHLKASQVVSASRRLRAWGISGWDGCVGWEMRRIPLQSICRSSVWFPVPFSLYFSSHHFYNYRRGRVFFSYVFDGCFFPPFFEPCTGHVLFRTKNPREMAIIGCGFSAGIFCEGLYVLSWFTSLPRVGFPE